MPVIRKKIAANILIIALFLCGAFLLNGNGGIVKAGTDDVYKNIEVLIEVLRQIEENYVEPQEPQELIHGAIKGMVRSLDPHSSFIDKG